MLNAADGTYGWRCQWQNADTGLYAAWCALIVLVYGANGKCRPNNMPYDNLNSPMLKVVENK